MNFIENSSRLRGRRVALASAASEVTLEGCQVRERARSDVATSRSLVVSLLLTPSSHKRARMNSPASEEQWARNPELRAAVNTKTPGAAAGAAPGVLTPHRDRRGRSRGGSRAR